MSLTRRLLVAAALTAALATPAAARGRLERLELTLGTLIGSGDIGSIRGMSAGLHTEVSKHFGDIGIVGQYDLLGVGEDPTLNGKKDPIRGLEHRLGVSARYTIGRVGKDFINADFWAEAGLGREFIQWDAGGKLTRDDITLAIGAHPVFTVGKQRYIGYFLAFRMNIAESPDAKFELPAVCAGPCDEPTPPSPTDLSFFFNFGITFGK